MGKELPYLYIFLIASRAHMFQQIILFYTLLILLFVTKYS